MVGLMYDLLANPLGHMRFSFERALASSPAAVGDPVAAFRGKDWGAVDIFRDFIYEQGGLSQIPVLDPSSLHMIQPNSLIRFRGMVQDMLGSELYIGAFKDGSTWRTNKYTDVASIPMNSTCETQLWERHLFHCIQVPGQNSWTVKPSLDKMNGNEFRCTDQQGGKRRREINSDEMDLQMQVADHGERSSSFMTKKQKEDELRDNLSHSSDNMNDDNVAESRNDGHNNDFSSFSCLVKVYDMPENHFKLNDVLEFIGIYTFDPELVVYKDESYDPICDLFEDPLAHLPPSKVPRIHCLLCQKLAVQDFLPNPNQYEPLPSVIREIRESLLGHLTATLGDDGLAAQFVLLHLLSKIRARVDVVTVGKLSLNLTGLNCESASIFGNQLSAAIQKLVPFTKSITLTVDFLNNTTLQPRKDNNTGRLVAGTLQLAEGTHLTIDETSMGTGLLNSNGAENARLLQHLMEWQKVEYDFEYYKLEMDTDIQLLILSEGKSNILPADLVLPLSPNTVISRSATEQELQAWRWYLATSKSLRRSCEPETHKIIQDEIVAALRQDRSLGYKDMSRWLTMAELMAASFGEECLSIEHWRMVKELESLRKQRLIGNSRV